MSDPESQMGTQVDPSEGALDEGAQQQSLQAAEAAGEELEYDPSEGPAE